LKKIEPRPRQYFLLIKKNAMSSFFINYTGAFDYMVKHDVSTPSPRIWENI